METELEITLSVFSCRVSAEMAVSITMIYVMAWLELYRNKSLATNETPNCPQMTICLPPQRTPPPPPPHPPPPPPPPPQTTADTAHSAHRQPALRQHRATIQEGGIRVVIRTCTSRPSVCVVCLSLCLSVSAQRWPFPA